MAAALDQAARTRRTAVALAAAERALKHAAVINRLALQYADDEEAIAFLLLMS
jgi:hypothetical protein